MSDPVSKSRRRLEPKPPTEKSTMHNHLRSKTEEEIMKLTPSGFKKKTTKAKGRKPKPLGNYAEWTHPILKELLDDYARSGISEQQLMLDGALYSSVLLTRWRRNGVGFYAPAVERFAKYFGKRLALVPIEGAVQPEPQKAFNASSFRGK